MEEQEIIIVGGGLAGLTSAIHLAMDGCKVVVFETNDFPHHKVCGEYVSKEIEPYLKYLGVDLLASGAKHITEFEISTPNGELIKTTLSMGGMGISRFYLDALLYKRAIKLGVTFYFEKVIDVSFKDDFFIIASTYRKIKSRIAIGAYGKRSFLDKKLKREFSFKKKGWLAVKAHYEYPDFAEQLVALHNFNGGYGGLSKTETGSVNFCYLVAYSEFKKYKDIYSFNTQVVSKNPHLDTFLRTAKPIFNSPMTIAQISFDKKKAVEDHMLMCGDTAGLIHPLCGNGMAMAIHSAKIASELVVKFLSEPNGKRLDLEKQYQKEWNKAFSSRLWFGRKLQRILTNRTMISLGIKTIGSSEKLLKFIIGKTHGALIRK